MEGSKVFPFSLPADAAHVMLAVPQTCGVKPVGEEGGPKCFEPGAPSPHGFAVACEMVPGLKLLQPS